MEETVKVAVNFSDEQEWMTKIKTTKLSPDLRKKK